METLLTIEQVVELGWSKATIWRKGRAGEVAFAIEQNTGREGRPRKLIKLSSLPADLQLRWHQRQPNVAEGIDESAATAMMEAERATEQPSGDRLLLLQAALSRIPLEERDSWIAELQRLAQLIDKYSSINPKRRANDQGKYEFVPEVLALSKEAACTDQVILAREPHRAKPPSPHTLDGWLRDFRSHGLTAFLRSLPKAEPTAKRDRRKAVISEPAIEWVNQHWRQYRNPRHLYKAAKRKAKQQGWTLPSETWFYRQWQKLPNPVKTLHLDGEKAYVSKFAPYIPRDASDLAALQLLCGDHRRCDVGVVWRDGRTLIRPWLTVWQDVRTGLIWGWHLDITPSSYTIGMAYAGGVIQFGAQPPACLETQFQSFVYTDNGKDYRSHNFDGTITIHKRAARLDGGIELIRVQRDIGIYRDITVEQYFARKGNAREKPLERTNRDFADWEEQAFEEWCGRDAKNKPDLWVDMWHKHQKFLKGKRATSPFMNFDTYLEHLAGFIQEYNASPHERTVLGGAIVVPLEEYERLYTTRYDITEESLAMLLMKPERRTIGKIGVGCSAAYKTWRYFHSAMSEFKGCEIEIRYDANDLSRVWAILPNGQICEAELVEKSGYLTPNKQTATLMKRQEAFERKTFKTWDYLNQSIVRGDSLEERVAAQFEVEEPEIEEAVAAEAGGRPHVHKMTRMDRPKLRSVPKSKSITADQVAQVEPEQTIFRVPDRGRVREFDYDED